MFQYSNVYRYIWNTPSCRPAVCQLLWNIFFNFRIFDFWRIQTFFFQEQWTQTIFITKSSNKSIWKLVVVVLPVENLLPQNVGSIINYLQQYTEAAQFGTPSCSWPQPYTHNGVRDGVSNWLVALPTLMRSTPWALVHSKKQCNLSGNRSCNRSMRGNHRSYAANEGIIYIFIYLYINHSSLRSDNKLSHCPIKREHS